MRILVLEHGQDDGPMLFGQWLTDAGATLDVVRCWAGDPIPTGTDGYDGVLCLGGAMDSWDDDATPWLPATRALLTTAVEQRTPTIGICLGAQLLALATGGRVVRGPDGPEVGAYLTAKRDAADRDPLLGPIPMTPDVMHCHSDVIEVLPPGAVLLTTGTGYPHQAFRIGPAAWGFQFHVETSAATLRQWAADMGLPGRLGPELDEAAEHMAIVWRGVAERFVALAGTGAPRALLPLTGA